MVVVAPSCAASGNIKGQPLNVPSYLENAFELLGHRQAGHPCARPCHETNKRAPVPTTHRPARSPHPSGCLIRHPPSLLSAAVAAGRLNLSGSVAEWSRLKTPAIKGELPL